MHCPHFMSIGSIVFNTNINFKYNNNNGSPPLILSFPSSKPPHHANHVQWLPLMLCLPWCDVTFGLETISNERKEKVFVNGLYFLLPIFSSGGFTNEFLWQGWHWFFVPVVVQNIQAKFFWIIPHSIPLSNTVTSIDSTMIQTSVLKDSRSFQ